MDKKPDQSQTPLFDAIKRHVDQNIIPFHVPGHKYGRGIKALKDYIGENALKMDLNGMEDLDYINNPTSVILEAQELAAHAFGAQNAFFLVNGTTSGIQAMILSACEPGSTIIIPRNAHKSAIGGIILSGAIPVYVQPEINKELGIAMGVTTDSIRDAIEQHPHAKAVFIMNPVYYGMASDLKQITEEAHMNNMVVIADEAHGAHMGFHPGFPLTAMNAGADMSSASIHKTAGSLTQSSILLHQGNSVSPDRIKQVLNLTYTSSASYLLMCSLDIARKQLATNGYDLLEKTLSLVRWARDEINKIDGLHAFGKEITGMDGCCDFDETKLGINVRCLGYTGYQIEAMLRDEYSIQVEMSDLYNILAIVTFADDEDTLAALINALKDISAKADKRELKNSTMIPLSPEMIVSPRDAFYNPKKIIRLEDASGEIAGEMIMAYPPGIPVISPGERISKDIIDYINILKKEKCQLQGTCDPYVNYIRVLGS